MTDIPEYLVSTGIVGSSAPKYATYVRRLSGSLRRVHSRGYDGEQLPERETRCEALEDLYRWLCARQVNSTPGTGYAEYEAQQKRIWAELKALKDAKG